MLRKKYAGPSREVCCVSRLNSSASIIISCLTLFKIQLVLTRSSLDMPDEIIRLLFSYIYGKTYWSARCASTRWHEQSAHELGREVISFRPRIDCLFESLFPEGTQKRKDADAMVVGNGERGATVEDADATVEDATVEELFEMWSYHYGGIEAERIVQKVVLYQKVVRLKVCLVELMALQKSKSLTMNCIVEKLLTSISGKVFRAKLIELIVAQFAVREWEAVPEDVIHDFDDEYRECWWEEPLDMFVIVMILRGELTNYEEHCDQLKHENISWKKLANYEIISWRDYLRSIYGEAVADRSEQ